MTRNAKRPVRVEKRVRPLDDDDRIGIAAAGRAAKDRMGLGLAARTDEELLRDGRLKGDESQIVIALVIEDELDGAVAEAARAIEKHDRRLVQHAHRLVQRGASFVLWRLSEPCWHSRR